MASYAMYTDDGDHTVQQMFDALKIRFKDDVAYLSRRHDELAANEPGYTDTAVRECIGNALAELLYEATEYFGEALKIDGEAFRKHVTNHFIDQQGGISGMLREYGLRI